MYNIIDEKVLLGDELFRGREEFLKIVKHYLENNNGHIISIDSNWGSGKTFFIERLMQELKINDGEESCEAIGNESNCDNGIVPIYIDCWEHQGSRSVENILVESIFEQLNKKFMVEIFLEYY